MPKCFAMWICLSLSLNQCHFLFSRGICITIYSIISFSLFFHKALCRLKWAEDYLLLRECYQNVPFPFSDLIQRNLHKKYLARMPVIEGNVKCLCQRISWRTNWYHPWWSSLRTLWPFIMMFYSVLVIETLSILCIHQIHFEGSKYNTS